MIVTRHYLTAAFKYRFIDGVIKQDYYKDHLVQQLPGVMERLIKRKKRINVLDMATGNGYTAIILSKYYERFINKIVAYDINPNAVELAESNARLNKCKINILDFRVGSLYDPLADTELFDIIISALPPVPIEPEELSLLPNDVKVHHWITSTAGRDGRNLLDGMIKGARKHLYNSGIVLTVQSDFQNAMDHTLKVMRRHSLLSSRLGVPKSMKLKNTKLTVLRKRAIVDLGYVFTRDCEGDERFFIETYQGIYVKN